MVFVVNYIIHSTTYEQAYSGARNSGFSDYASPQVRCTAEYMPGFRYILHITLSKGKAQQKIPLRHVNAWVCPRLDNILRACCTRDLSVMRLLEYAPLV